MQNLKQMDNIAVLLTCHNRMEKTIACLKSFYSASSVEDYNFVFFFVDDGSTDGTTKAVRELFPNVIVIIGDGSLFWAGGMRLAWQSAIEYNLEFSYYLLLNDDTTLFKNSLLSLFGDVASLNTPDLILIGSTMNNNSDRISYGGKKLHNRKNPASSWVIPNSIEPQNCDLGNANIMLVGKSVVNKLGILSDKYTHGIADYDYTIKAVTAGTEVYVCSEYLGICEDDHGNNWLSRKSSLKERVDFLYSVKGLAYKEHLFFIRTNFPSSLLESKCKLWLKTLFPYVWDIFKGKSSENVI
jgi:GT2 family glycosyltransferase